MHTEIKHYQSLITNPENSNEIPINTINNIVVQEQLEHIWRQKLFVAYGTHAVLRYKVAHENKFSINLNDNIMNTKDIEKREELCRLLNMNFDETTELFSDETMQSMQMAQVNGGIAPIILAGVKWLCTVIGTAASGAAIYEFVKSDDNTEQGSISSGPTPPFTTSHLESLIGAFGRIPTDSTKFNMTSTEFGVTLYYPGKK